MQIFNRDEPDREKQVHVTVKASDNGKPPLEDVCTIAVKISDINDNPPIFDRANYDVPVAQVKMDITICPKIVDSLRNSVMMPLATLCKDNLFLSISLTSVLT